MLGCFAHVLATSHDLFCFCAMQNKIANDSKNRLNVPVKLEPYSLCGFQQPNPDFFALAVLGHDAHSLRVLNRETNKTAFTYTLAKPRDRITSIRWGYVLAAKSVLFTFIQYYLEG